jgi:hypothetical protein
MQVHVIRVPKVIGRILLLCIGMLGGGRRRRTEEEA